jgi:predicted cupin superfamily sugar epimerase
MPDDAQTWIDRLGLEAHPEGGYYRETYRADERIPASVLPARFDGARDAAALIYFLLPADTFSALHRIRQDEAWHFYVGAPLTLHQIAPDGTYTTTTLGRAVGEGHRLQTVVPAGTWFGATVDDTTANADGDYALVGCTTAPAFDFADFDLADRAALIESYPQHRALIERLTRVE